MNAKASAVVIAILVALGAWFVIGADADRTQDDTQSPGAGFVALGEATEGIDIGQRAPELAADDGSEEVVRDLEGQPITLASLRGRPVWLVFWATWCPPCQAETPDLQRAYAAHEAEGLELIAIDVQETAEIVTDYMATYDLTYTGALDPSGSIMRSYGVFGLPTHYFIDDEGIIRDRFYGPMSLEQMEERLASILPAADALAGQ